MQTRLFWFSLFKKLSWCPGLTEYLKACQIKEQKMVNYAIGFFSYYGLFLYSTSPPNSAIQRNVNPRS